jgi:endonuclease-3
VNDRSHANPKGVDSEIGYLNTNLSKNIYATLTSMKRTPQQTWDLLWPILNTTYKRTKTYLDHRNPFELLIAVILSAQTTDEGVNIATKELFKKYPTPKKLAQAPLGDIARIIRRVGYYNTKARYIKSTAERLMTDFKGRVPLDEENLRTLPGVGRKTAVVVLSHLGQKNFGIPVDTHVIRFAKRFALSPSNNPDQIERDLQKLIPQKHWKRAAYAIKDYGRKEGKARGYQKQHDPLWRVLQ